MKIDKIWDRWKASKPGICEEYLSPGSLGRWHRGDHLLSRLSFCLPEDRDSLLARLREISPLGAELAKSIIENN